MGNKVKFNLSNAHYAPITVGEDGENSYGTPVALPGAVSISLDPNGEPESFYADGIEYYIINNNMGYDGDLELAMIPESFRTGILKEEADANKVLVENCNSETGSFALLFEFDGDVKAKTGDETTKSIYDGCYQAVYMPTSTPAVEAAPLSFKTVAVTEKQEADSKKS